jgi:hypothetical protein
VLSGEAANTNFTVFGLTGPGIEPKISHTRSEQSNHYTTDLSLTLTVICYIKMSLLSIDSDFLYKDELALYRQ